MSWYGDYSGHPKHAAFIQRMSNGQGKTLAIEAIQRMKEGRDGMSRESIIEYIEGYQKRYPSLSGPWVDYGLTKEEYISLI